MIRRHVKRSVINPFKNFILVDETLDRHHISTTINKYSKLNMKSINLKISAAALMMLATSLAVAQQVSKSWKDTPSQKVNYLKKAPAGAPNILLILLDDVG